MEQPEDNVLVSLEVQGCLEKVVQQLGVADYTTDITAATIRGDNYLGIIARAQVKGKDKNNKDVILNFIVKSAPRSGLFRSFTPIRNAYDREIYVYSTILPLFAKFQKEKCIANPFNSVANYYESTMEDMNEALIMDNMKEIGYVLRDRHKPFDLNHVLLVLRQYGKFHAISFALRDQKPELFEELSKKTQDIFLESMVDNMKKMPDGVNLQTGKALESLDPVKHKVAYERFKKFQDNMLDVVVKVIQPEPAGKSAVIVHGDCWVNNMLFKYDDASNLEVPSKVCLLDWQLSHLGSPALDLSYFIFTSTEKELRDQYYDHFIEEYYKSLSSHLRQLGSDPEKLFPFDVLQEHLKQFSVYGLYMSVMILFAIISEVEEIPDFSKETNMEELLEKYKDIKPKNINQYNSRISGVILDFVRLGYDF